MMNATQVAVRSFTYRAFLFEHRAPRYDASVQANKLVGDSHDVDVLQRIECRVERFDALLQLLALLTLVSKLGGKENLDTLLELGLLFPKWRNFKIFGINVTFF
jgi:hypothetical protein